MTSVFGTDISPQEFGQIFSRYRDKFILIARSYVRDRTVAEDIVADSFTSFWDNRSRVDEEIHSLEAYILRIVRNRCLNYLRDEANRLRIEQEIQERQQKRIMADIEILSGDDPSDLFSDDIAAIFRRLISSMPVLTRQIFLASRMSDLTYQEIAEKFNISERKVKREIQTVLSAMRTSLKDYLP